ncbi:MAG: DUF1801 domain-containing protein [Chloroflexota bacterium]
MQSNAKDVKSYLAELPDERRKAIEAVRHVILANLPPGYEEVMNWGMITYQVPLQDYPDTYNGKPLMYAALASQKNHMSLYLTSIYADDSSRQAFEESYRQTGKRYDVGKSCVRFRKLEDLPLELIGKSISSCQMPAFIHRVRTLQSMRKSKH